MALFYKCGFRKLVAGCPSIFAAALIIYISMVFLFAFLPYVHPQWTFFRVLITVPFVWFSGMTLVSIFQTAASDPGYLSIDYQHPLSSEGHAPLSQLRIHNMKMFQRLKLYDFSQVHRVDEEANNLLHSTSGSLEEISGEVELRQISR